MEEKECIARNYSYYSDEVKYIRDFFKNKKVDIPTLDEVKSLVDVKKEKCFNGKLNNGYYSFANGSYRYTLYRKSDNYIKGFDVKKNESCSNCGGYHFPLIRLTDKKELSNKEIFLLFLEKKLKPNNFKSKAYDLLFKMYKFR